MKIKKTYTSDHDSELSILNSLYQKNKFHDGVAHVISMLHWFVIRGSIGNHLCLVFEALGPSFSAILDLLPKYLKPGVRVFTGASFPLPMAKRILCQILLGISYLYSKHVIYGDIHCGNLLLIPPNLNLANSDNLAPYKAEGNFLVTRLDPKIDLSAP